KYLHSLCYSRRQFTSTLNSVKIGDRYASPSQRRGKNVRGGYRVLNCQIDAHATDWRHCVSGIADAKEPAAIPLAQTVDFDRQQLDLIPALQFIHTVTQERHNRYNVLPESCECCLFDPIELTLTN